MLFETEGYRPPTIAKTLESEGIFVSRRGVAKFLLQVKATGSLQDRLIVEDRSTRTGKHDNRSGVHSATCVNVYIVHIYSIVCV